MAKKKLRRPASDGELNITSMMDMMTIILVFLLKSYNSTSVTVEPSSDLIIPLSSAKKPPVLAVNVVVSQRQILVDGVSVIKMEKNEAGEAMIPEAEKNGPLILLLRKKLEEKAELAKALGARVTGGDADFKGQILLQCDKRLPFSVIREVMYTAGQAQYAEFRFVVVRGGG